MARKIRQWYEKHPELYSQEKKGIKEHYPEFNFGNQGDDLTLSGDVYIEKGSRVISRFALRVVIPDDYPSSLPLVYEVEGLIPREANRHINDRNGQACLFVPDERWKFLRIEDTTLVAFLSGPVYQFFLNQSYYERTGRWLFEGRSHYADGILEYYFEEFSTRDEVMIAEYLMYLANPAAKGHWLCPCGSERKVRNCHNRLVELHGAKIPPKVAKASLSMIHGQAKRFQETKKRNDLLESAIRDHIQRDS